MTTEETSPEHLTPGQEFIQIIDAHFAAVDDGEGEPSDRLGEERIELMAPNFEGLLGIEHPRIVDAIRTIPGLEAVVETGWPESHGPRVRTFIFSDDISQTITFFERSGEVWVRSSLSETYGEQYSVYFEGYGSMSEAPLGPDMSQRFLDWLKDCTPFLPNPIADL